MKRITATAVRQAYKKTGITPRRNTWLSNPPQEASGRVPRWDRSQKWCGTEGCGAAVIAIASNIGKSGLHQSALNTSAVAKHLGLDEVYLTGFTYGFDGKNFEATDARALKGYKDGQKAAAAVIQG